MWTAVLVQPGMAQTVLRMGDAGGNGVAGGVAAGAHTYYEAKCACWLLGMQLCSRELSTCADYDGCGYAQYASA